MFFKKRKSKKRDYYEINVEVMRLSSYYMNEINKVHAEAKFIATKKIITKADIVQLEYLTRKANRYLNHMHRLRRVQLRAQS